MSNCKDFNGKVVLITGSSSGIGREIALYLSSLGAQVVITGRDEERVQIVAEKCRELSQQKVLEVVADVNRYDDIERLIYETIDEFGKLDVLVNSAGVSQLSPISSPDLMQIYNTTMGTNVKGVLYLSSLSVPYLEKTKGIRVNSINPASVRTPIFDKFGVQSFSLQNMIEMTAKSYPLGRIGEPIDCAKAVAYLASDDASFVSSLLPPKVREAMKLSRPQEYQRLAGR
ncbi:unnamed protein product, partial [Medioppia subpectinata]